MDRYVTSERERFDPTAFEASELNVISGAINRYGVQSPCHCTPRTLISFTWEQAVHALTASKCDCHGDALDTVIDALYAVKEAQHARAN